MSKEKGIHFAEDCKFHRRAGVYHASREDLLASSLAFQRELINHIIPEVQPDIIHCNDWMTGLIPAAAKKMGIPTLFTIHNIHSQRATLADIDHRGIAGDEFWDELYFENYPDNYEESFWFNPIDFLASGIRAADHVNVVSPSFLEEVISGHHDNIPGHISHLLWHKNDLGKASGIINAPDGSFDPLTDVYLPENYGPGNHRAGKAANKIALQRKVGLVEDDQVPLFFWPSRLDPTQKGCQLLAHIIHDVVRYDHASSKLQFVISADGPFLEHFHEIVRRHGLEQQVAVRGFSEDLSHLAFAASDFVLMPSSFEPCGLPQMIGCCYGSLPVVHHTGGLKDTVKHFNESHETGNGFAFNNFDSEGLRWAINEAMSFRQLPLEKQQKTVERVMTEAKEQFSPRSLVNNYSALYQKILATSA